MKLVGKLKVFPCADDAIIDGVGMNTSTVSIGDAIGGRIYPWNMCSNARKYPGFGIAILSGGGWLPKPDMGEQRTLDAAVAADSG